MTFLPTEPHGLRHVPRLPSAEAAPRVRVFVVHNHPVYRVGVVSVLAAEPSVLCVGEAADLAEAVHTAPPLAPEVLLLDRNMPDAADVETLDRLRQQLPRLRLVVLASRLDPQAPKGLPVAGVSLVLPRSTSAADLLAAIRCAHESNDGTAQPQADTRDNCASRLGADLTRRERDLLALMARGMPNREICSELDIAMPTVKFHVTNILAKLQVENRTSAVLVALRNKLVSID